MNRAEWRRAGLAAVLTLHVIGFAILLAPHGAGSALGVHWLSRRLQDSSALSVVGATVSGSFLYLIALANLVLMAGALRDGPAAQPSGPMFRLFERLFRTVDKPWHMYPVGLLFGLGFDTATEVALLILAAGAALGGLPMYAIVCLPILFAAGMSLLDTLDGAFMTVAYGWSSAAPARRHYYNQAVTGLSVAVALVVGTVELLSVAGLADVDLSLVGFEVAGLLALTWAVAAWRSGRIEGSRS